MKKKVMSYFADVICFNCRVVNGISVETGSLVKDHIRRVNCSCKNCGFRLK